MPIIKVSRNTSSLFPFQNSLAFHLIRYAKLFGDVEWRSLMSWLAQPSHAEGNKQTKKETHFTYLLWRMLLLGILQNNNNNNSVNNYCWGYRGRLTCWKDGMHGENTGSRHWHNLPICVTNLVNGEFQVTAAGVKELLTSETFLLTKFPPHPPLLFFMKPPLFLFREKLAG